VNPISESDRRGLLDFALGLVEDSRRVIEAGVRRGYRAQLKADASLVTDVDREVEHVLRERITQRYEDHGIIGEEFANSRPDADFQWILDPIDGTDNFAHGIPTFGTLIALRYKAIPLVGVIDHPRLELCYGAAAGLGAFRNGAPIRIAGRDERVPVEREIIVTTAPENFLRSGNFELFTRIQRAHPNTRIYRDCFGHSRAIEGAAGAMLDFNVRVWDIAAAEVLVTEAGGQFVRLSGAEGGYERVVFGKRAVVASLLALLAP
jgi:fructose-1,6-bisphosphatase/inositol monophosphatase family enzyme